jgi:hypothetical protein
MMALPHRVDSVATFHPAEAPSGPVFAVVRPDAARRAFDADVVDAEGRVLVRVRGYRTVELPGGFDTSALDPLKWAMMSDSDEGAVAQAAAVERT